MKSSIAQKEWKHADYISEKEYYRNRDRKRYARYREVIHEAKNRPCADCGIEYPPYVMDFDHRKGKKYNVSLLTKFSSEIKLREEIAKCDVVCANCHRERTHNKKLIAE